MSAEEALQTIQMEQTTIMEFTANNSIPMVQVREGRGRGEGGERERGREEIGEGSRIINFFHPIFLPL